MPVSKRLAGTPNASDVVVVAPTVLGRATELSRSGTDATLRTFDADSDIRDIRARDQVQLVTLGAASGTNAFVLNGFLNGANRGPTVSFVRLTNMTAAAIQTALRTMFPEDPNLTVTGTTDAGPFTITFCPTGLNSFTRHYPKFVQTGYAQVGTALPVITRVAYASGVAGTQEPDSHIQDLGESIFVSPTNTILKPTIGTITVVPGVAAVQTITHTGVSAGTFDIGYKGNVAPGNQWNVTAAALQTVLRALHPDLAAVTVTSDVSPRVVTFVGSGRPMPVLNLSAYGLTGGVFVIATTTPGLYGTISAAFTLNGGATTGLVTAVRDTPSRGGPGIGQGTGVNRGDDNSASFGVYSGASPAVIGATTGLQGITPGAYHVACRGVEAGRVSKADNKAFTMTSS